MLSIIEHRCFNCPPLKSYWTASPHRISQSDISLLVFSSLGCQQGTVLGRSYSVFFNFMRSELIICRRESGNRCDCKYLSLIMLGSSVGRNVFFANLSNQILTPVVISSTCISRFLNSIQNYSALRKIISCLQTQSSCSCTPLRSRGSSIARSISL